MLGYLVNGSFWDVNGNIIFYFLNYVRFMWKSIELNDILYVRVEDFQTSASVILKDGDFTSFSNKHCFCPHYKRSGFEVFFTPSHLCVNFVAERSKEVSDYNTLVIKDYTQGTPTKSHRLILQGVTVVLMFDTQENGNLVL